MGQVVPWLGACEVTLRGLALWSTLTGTQGSTGPPPTARQSRSGSTSTNKDWESSTQVAPGGVRIMQEALRGGEISSPSCEQGQAHAVLPVRGTHGTGISEKAQLGMSSEEMDTMFMQRQIGAGIFSCDHTMVPLAVFGHCK